MTRAKCMGICMDDATAHLIKFTTDALVTQSISSPFTQPINGENGSQEQHQQADYYKQLGEEIIHCNEVILFGPTDAKLALLNILITDNRFAHLKIRIKYNDKMTENQEQAFVKDYFSGH